MPEVIPYLFYRDLPTALDWLARAFGLAEVMRTGTPSGGMHGEMRCGDALIMMGQPTDTSQMSSPRDSSRVTMGVFVYLDEDVDKHHARAAAAGAAIAQPPHDQSFGRTYTAFDLEGPPWFFTARPAAADGNSDAR